MIKNGRNDISNIQESKNLLVQNIIFKKIKNSTIIKLHRIFIYLNLIIIYIILCKFYIINIKKQKYIEANYPKYFDIISDDTEYKEEYEFILNKYMRTSIDWPLPRKIKFKPLLSKKELKAFLYFMKPENIYFEFGSGGSTNIASYYKLKSYSVESDVKWHDKLKHIGIVANYITIDLNASSKGYPGKETNVNEWKKYIQAYKKEYNADIIFIDGRFRVACALDIFNKIRNDTIVIIHDYTQRKEYHILERFYKKVKVWDSLALFLKNTEINSIPNELYSFYLQQQK